MSTEIQKYRENTQLSVKVMDITSSFNSMKKKKNIKTKKVPAVVKVGRPRKNKKGQVLNPKTGKFLTGRPPVINKEKLHKLEIAFGYGCTDAEACAFADISESTLYNYQKENEKFLERKEQLKQLPNLQARKVVVESMKTNPATGQWWLEKKLPSEFGKSGGTNVAIQINNTINKKKKDYGI